jgi:hypothetical protein
LLQTLINMFFHSSFSLLLRLTALGLTLRLSVQQQSVGISYHDPFEPYSVILPTTVAQCEPALIYYNITSAYISAPLITIESPDGLLVMDLFSLPDSQGSGYVQWICNLPAGSVFQIYLGVIYSAWYTVQPGSDSSCIGTGGVSEVDPIDMSKFLTRTYSPQEISSYIASEHTKGFLLFVE